MVIRVYVSGISGNKEVKKRQQRVTMILDSKNLKYNVIDIAEPGNENEKEFMQENSKVRDSKHPLPPQIFNGDHYCGDYEDFDMANELDELEKFLSVTASDIIENGISNGTKTAPSKQDSFKEDIQKSSEEIVSLVENISEAVSLGNDEIEQSTSNNGNQHDPEAITNTTEVTPNALDEIPEIPEQITYPHDESPKLLDEDIELSDKPSTPFNENAKLPLEIPEIPESPDETSEISDEIPSVPSEHESMNGNDTETKDANNEDENEV